MIVVYDYDEDDDDVAVVDVMMMFVMIKMIGTLIRNERINTNDIYG